HGVLHGRLVDLPGARRTLDVGQQERDRPSGKHVLRIVPRPARYIGHLADGGPLRLLDLDEDALPGALFGGLDDRLLEVAGHVGQALDPTRVAEHLAAFLDVGQAVVEEGEDVGTDLLTQAVARAEVLVDPHLHGHAARSLLAFATRNGTVSTARCTCQFTRFWREKLTIPGMEATPGSECHWCTL